MTGNNLALNITGRNNDLFLYIYIAFNTIADK